MGYTTYFEGELEIKGRMSREFVEYINRFSNTRRMKRDIDKIKLVYPNWKELCFNGELGVEGEYLAIISEQFGQEEEASIENFNYPPSTQPGLWCQWVVTEDGEYLEWDGGEKFYNYVEWLEYLIENFFRPMDYVLNGDITWQGEDYDDFGTIHVVNNVVDVQNGIRISSMEDVETEAMIAELERRGYKVS